MIEINEYLLCNFEDNLENVDTNNLLWKCDWIKIIKNTDFLTKFISNNFNFNNFTTTETSDSILKIAIACLMAFVQENFTGPDLEYNLNDIVNWPENVNSIHLLSVDSEEINVNTRKPELLLASKYIFEYLVENGEYNFITQWWMIRSIMIHQKVLDDTTNTLYTKFLNSSEKLISEMDTLDDMKLRALLLIEITQGFLLFRRIVKAEDLLTKTINMLGIDINIESMLGIRTKYQTKPLPQLALSVNLHECLIPSANETHKETCLPALLRLEDDLRLEIVKFCAEDDNKLLTLPSVIQTLILTKVQLIQLSQPKDKLADEELEPFLRCLMYQEHGPLTTRIATLLIQVKLEANHKRTVDRSLKQSESLVQLLNGKDVSIKHRLSYVFASGLLPRWSVEARLGDIMLTLGLVKTALDLYIRLQLWEEVICCYTILNLKHKAADVIRQELEKNATVKLYCLLGDSTDDPTCYEKAWELSKHKSGRVQRHWGNYYFAKKEYETAIPYLEKSLEINSLQEVGWLRLGYAALTIENWKLAANAYRRYTQLEPYGFESWNNLAKAYIKQGDKHRAHKILHEALKCNYNNWQVWENFLFVSMDTGHFEDGINAYNRLIEIKSKYIDKEVLQILINAVANNTPDADGQLSNRLKKKTQTLLGHICVQIPNDGLLWELAAKLCNSEPLAKAQKLQKAYRSYTQTSSLWSKDPEKCEKVLKLCLDLCSASLEASQNFTDGEKASVVSQISSARLSVQGCAKAASNEKWPNCELLVKELEENFEIITAELKKHI